MARFDSKFSLKNGIGGNASDGGDGAAQPNDGEIPAAADGNGSADATGKHMKQHTIQAIRPRMAKAQHAGDGTAEGDASDAGGAYDVHDEPTAPIDVEAVNKALADGGDQAPAVIDKSGFVGTWKLDSMACGENPDSDPALLKDRDFGVIVLAEDGTAQLDMLGEKIDGTWEAVSGTEAKLFMEDGDGKASSPLELADGKLSMRQDGDRLVFEKTEQEAVDQLIAVGDGEGDGKHGKGFIAAAKAKLGIGRKEGTSSFAERHRERARIERRGTALDRVARAGADMIEMFRNGDGWGKAASILYFLWSCVLVAFKGVLKLLSYVAVALVVSVLVGGLFAVGLIADEQGRLPSLADASMVVLAQDSTIYDSDNNVIGVVSTLDRKPVNHDDIAQCMLDALVAIEDERFFDHEGVDFIGMARALVNNLKPGTGLQGGSTITQQYVRNAYESVGFEQTTRRKLTEIVLAVQLEATTSKDAILTNYLNTIYFGNGCYGVEAASLRYFNKHASELDYYQAAMLAAIVNAPSANDPLTEEGLERTVNRTCIVLDKMYSLGKLGGMSQEELRALKKKDPAEELDPQPAPEREINDPYYYEYVMSVLRANYEESELEQGGWQVYTTLSMEEANTLRSIASQMEERKGADAFAAEIVDVDAATGALKAFVGGTSWERSQFNTASAPHQTGSAFKPFVYATLVDRFGYFMDDTMDTTPVTVTDADGSQHSINSYLNRSTATLQEALNVSDNSAAYRACTMAGIENVAEVGRACGIQSEIELNPIVSIGGQSVGFTPIDLATAYATLANKGYAHDTWCVRQITDTMGNQIYEHEDTADNSRQAIDPNTAAIMDASLVEVANTASWIDISFAKRGGWTVGAKTGGSDWYADAWCCATDGTRAMAAWIGGRDAKQQQDGDEDAVWLIDQALWAVAQGDPKENVFPVPEKKIRVPEVEDGTSWEWYESQLYRRNLSGLPTYVANTGYDDGTVISVEGAGTLVDRGSSIGVKVAISGVSVPNVTGLTLSEAVTQLQALNVSVSCVMTSSGTTVPTVVQQSIEAGRNVAEGTDITLTVEILQASSTTQVQIPMRNTSSSLDQMKDQRDALQKQLDDLYEAYTEAEQSAETLIIPDVSGLGFSSARKVLESVGLGAIHDSGSVNGVVSYTSPVAGSKVSPGTTVRIVTTIPVSNNGSSGSGTASDAGDDDDGSSSSGSSNTNGNGSSSNGGNLLPIYVNSPTNGSN